MRFVNLTSHDIVIFLGDGTTCTVLPSGIVARTTMESEVVAIVNGVQITKDKYGEVFDLPEPQDGVLYIASHIVCKAAHRSDVICPGAKIFDKDKNEIGCRGLRAIY